jgi:4-amino-4-deoxy-L-arabinose transferase-like glycosyltransferase
MKRETATVLALAFSLLLVCLMPTSQSLWIDEGFTVPYAQDHSFGQFLTRLENEKGSEALMPLGMLSSWAGAKVFGVSELGLRVVSAIWAAIAVVLLWRAGAVAGLVWLPALLACHPFLWYYASEVRPYAMVIAMGAGLAYGLVALVTTESGSSRGLYALLLFGPLLCATQVLGVVPCAAVAAAAAAVLLRRRWRPRASDLAALAASGVGFVLLGLYYATVIARGADINWEGPWRVGLNNILFSAYELLGFTGFGPGRYELRQSALGHGVLGALDGFGTAAAAGVAVLAILYALIVLRFVRRSRSLLLNAKRLAFVAVFVIVASVGVMFVLCLVAGSPFWGRHLAALLPFVVLGIAAAADAPRRGGRRTTVVLTALVGAALLTSSLMIRLAPRHSRDDYRSAARIARLAVRDGKTVWWAAAIEPAAYYRVTPCEVGSEHPRGCVFLTDNRTDGDLTRLPAPDLIVLSKPELYDNTGAVRGYVTRHHLRLAERLTAFEVFTAR